TIKLNKTTEGEIKEKKINGVNSRWIRCILEEHLPVDVPRRLPMLDNIVFVVKSSGKNLLPDQAFNNVSPLDITQPFTPFGQEPRMFDNFSIASKEAFSKKGAKVEIDVKVEPRGILGAPTAITFTDYGQEIEKIRVFVRGTYGRLMEVKIDPTRDDPTREKEPFWRDHGFPPDTKIASEATPCAVTDDESTFISVFARAENGHLVESFYNGEQWQWIDRGAPNGVDVKFDPAAIYKEISGNDGYKIISVFVIGFDDRLYELKRDPDTMMGTWVDHPKPEEVPSIASSPYVDDSHGSYFRRVKVFFTGQNEQLYELDCEAGNNQSDGWKTHYGSPSLSVKVDSRPFAKVFYNYDSGGPLDGYYAKVFVKGSNDALYELDTRYPNNWIYLGVPKENEKKIKVSPDPHGYVLNPKSI
ncbi:MAG: hypothetical protein IMF19_14710, partial [Proteobacteria bacterium]|nr:hypothetical protein [Pseudomonadota bacterium]